MRLYNTLTRRQETFEPLDPERVAMYVCGPTVYSHPHIGNARAAVVFDVLYRALRRRYPNVRYVRNVTDVDDKINEAAEREGVPIGDIADRYRRAYHEDMAALGVEPPSLEPRVTAHIPEIVAMIARLLDNGHAYEAEGHVLFSVPDFPAYGHLSGRNRDEMIAGARVEVAPFKRDPADFVLWKPSGPGLPAWDSPWGPGRPGWHIECSAMAAAALGETIDIHGGGQDLIFPHHENEIAQSTCAHGGSPFARYWVHNGFVRVRAEKMSKSRGNVLLVHDLLQQAPPEATRYALLAAHYRSPLEWDDSVLQQARHSLDRLYGALREAPAGDGADGQPPEDFRKAIDDDLNTPLALSCLHRLAREIHTGGGDADALRAAGAELGLLQQEPERWFHGAAPTDETQVNELLAERATARREGDYAKADELRARLRGMGIDVQDRLDGEADWRRT